MVLIFSESKDNSTTLVLDWLLADKVEFMVICYEQAITIRAVRFEQYPIFIFTVDGIDGEFRTDQFDAVWYRRAMPAVLVDVPIPEGITDVHLRQRLLGHISWENRTMAEEFKSALSKIPSLGSPFHCDERTLRDLEAFASIGGHVPRTLITSRKSELIEFIGQCPRGVIAKKLNHAFDVRCAYGLFGQFTETLDQSFTHDLPETFGLSLFQERIPKFAELRVYVLDDKLFSMAIFSQSDVRTQVDFRNYVEDRPVRTAPYELPERISMLVFAFMRKIGTNSGSIDIILTPSGEFVFLEINTIGQFGMVSQVCNYNFEKKIAHEIQRLADAGGVVSA